MKEIKLTKGYAALVDDCDFDNINKFKWAVVKNKHLVYAIRTSSKKDGRKTIRMHRQIMNVNDRYQEVDHIDGNGLNNCRNNLRVCNREQNSWNYSKPSTNKSGFKGVHYSKWANMYRARIQAHGEVMHLGYFKNPVEAAKAYNEAAKKHFGEFAKVNKL